MRKSRNNGILFYFLIFLDTMKPRYAACYKNRLKNDNLKRWIAGNLKKTASEVSAQNFTYKASTRPIVDVVNENLTM